MTMRIVVLCDPMMALITVANLLLRVLFRRRGNFEVINQLRIGWRRGYRCDMA